VSERDVESQQQKLERKQKADLDTNEDTPSWSAGKEKYKA
jgi:hypothetical protein